MPTSARTGFSPHPGRAHGPCPTRRCVIRPGRTGASAPTIAFVGAGFYPAHGRGNRRSAAGGGRSEAISRKCPDWRPRQWPGIGWHNGGQESPSPTHPLYPPVGAGVPDGPLTALLAMCHCETSDRCHWLWQSASSAPGTSCESNDTQIPSASGLPLRHCLPFCEKNFLKNKNL